MDLALGIRNSSSGFWKIHEVMDCRFAESFSSSFFVPNFCHIWLFFKVECARGAGKLWKIIKYGIKKMKKSLLFNLPSQPISSLISGTRKPNFWYPNPFLVSSAITVADFNGNCRKHYAIIRQYCFGILGCLLSCIYIKIRKKLLTK